MPKKCKKGWKNIFDIFDNLAKNNKSESKRKNKKWLKNHTMGQGGAKWEKRCKKQG